MTSNRRLTRSSHGMIGGVCAGIANFFGWNADYVRLGYVLLSIFSAAFPGLLVYLVLWLVLPRSTGRGDFDLRGAL